MYTTEELKYRAAIASLADNMLYGDIQDMETDRNSVHGDDKDAKSQDRINLQTLGAFIRNGDHRKKLDKDSFAQREQKAYDKLEHELKKYMNEEELAAIENSLSHYSAVKEEIQFTLGMRAGAELILQLTSNQDYDY